MDQTAASFPWSLVDSPAPGNRTSGYFRWDDPLFDGIEWPYFAIRGAEPGPAITIIAAVHGGEYPGILAAQRIGRNIDPTRVRGSILILPMLNPPAFWERSAFVSPPDGRNPNRVFPGSATGTYSERLAYFTLRDVIAPADVLIDLHSGDVFESLASHVGGYITGDTDRDALTRQALGAFGVRYAWLNELTDHPVSLTASSAALGKQIALVEVGGNALASPAEVELVERGVSNLLVVYGALRADLEVGDHIVVRPASSLRAPADGLWLPNVQIEQHVHTGDLLGTLTDPLGDSPIHLRAETDGMVLYHLTALAACRDDPLVSLVTLEEGSV